MPVLVPDAPSTRPQLSGFPGAPHPPIFAGHPQGERGPSSSGKWDRGAWLLPWRADTFFLYDGLINESQPPPWPS